MSVIKVLHISSNGNIGGREKMLYQLVNLENKDPEIVPSVFLKYCQGPYFEKILKLGVPVFESQKFSYASFYDTIRQFQSFDILVFHFVDWFLFLCAILSGRPICYRLSGIYLLTKKTYKDVLILFLRIAFRKKNKKKFSDEKASKPSNRVMSLPNTRSIYRIVKRHYFKLFLQYFCDQIIVNSYYTALAAVKFYGTPIRKITVVYNGIPSIKDKNIKASIRNEFNIRESTFLIGTVCRFDTRKRIDRLLEGFAYLREYEDYKLIIVGGGDVNLESQFKQFAVAHGLESRVIFAGLRSDVDHLLGEMDLFVLPSDNEAFGIAVVEAMQNEVPVIVFNDSGGPVEILGRNGECGYVIERPEEIAQIALLLNQNPKLAEQLGRKASEVVRERFSIERFQQDFKKTYWNYCKKM